MEKLLETGAFIPQGCRIVSPTFVIPKKDGSMRLIHDLRQVNARLAAPKFTLHGVREVAEVVRQSNFLVSLDLKKGYQQVAVAKEARPYLGAMHGGKTVAATVLPFGLSISPYIFTRLTNWLARKIRDKFKLNTAVYIDDLLLGAKDRESLEEGLQGVREMFGRLGVIISDKTSQVPDHKVECLGFVWDSEEKTISITDKRRKEYRRKMRNLLRCPQTRTTWKQVIGRLLFLREVIGPTLRRTRSLMHCVRRRTADGLVRAEGEARQDLLWWVNTLSKPFSLSLRQDPVTATLATDASDWAMGGVVETWNPRQQGGMGERHISFHAADGGGKKEVEQAKVEGFRRHLFQKSIEDTSKHINIKELQALLEPLKTHREDLKGRRAIWFSDSVTARAAVTRQGTQALSKEAWEVTNQIVD